MNDDNYYISTGLIFSLTKMPNFDLAHAFKTSMDAAGLRPSHLAERAGRSRQNISDIRNGRVSPNIRDFGELLAIAEELSPGFVERWATELVGASGFFSPAAIATLDRKQLAMMLHLIADQLRPTAQSKTPKNGKMEEVLTAS